MLMNTIYSQDLARQLQAEEDAAAEEARRRYAARKAAEREMREGQGGPRQPRGPAPLRQPQPSDRSVDKPLPTSSSAESLKDKKCVIM
jgi:hypothetical protein